tara:strand:- start:37927 stop:39009 length:1083 start_codon:yes stop_codon:yes gene_type:complete
MIKKTFLYLAIITLIHFNTSCSKDDTTEPDPIIENPIEDEDLVQTHVPITAFWFNGGWEHYDPESLKHIDEIIIFAIPANPDTGDLLTHGSSTAEETVYIRGKTEPGLTTTMIRTITNDAKKNNVKVTLGINGMGRKDKQFNDLVRNEKHEIFADNILAFCKKWDIDGVDIDYEHVITTEDAGFLTAIVTALRDKLHPEGFHVSGAFGISRQPVLDWLKNNHQLLDQINVMGYLNTPDWCDSNLNDLHSVYGVPSEKIFCGLGFYAKGKDLAGNTLSYQYRDLVDMITIDNTVDSFTIPHPDNSGETVVLEFNNGETSLQEKVNIVRNNDLGGMMVWALNHDVPASESNSRIKYLRSITD